MDINNLVKKKVLNSNRITNILFISNPIVPFLYFVNSIFLLFLFNNMFFITLAFLIIILELIYLFGKEKALRNYKYYLLIFIVLVTMNLLFVHRGENIIFYFLGKPITVESLFYGIYNGLFLISMLMAFSILNEIVGTKGIIYIFSNIIPQISFLLSFTLRWTNLLNVKAKEYFLVQNIKKTNEKSKNIEKKVENLEFFIKNSLEEGFIVGETLKTKDYGKYKRNNYKKLKFFIEDIVFITFQIILTGILFYMSLKGIGKTEYYNNSKKIFNRYEYVGIVIYSIFLLLPIIIDFILKIRKKRSIWKY